MNKLLYALLLTFTFLAPQGALEANSNHDSDKSKHAKHNKHHKHSRHHGRGKHSDDRFATKADLELINQDIADINASLDALELQVGISPEELAAELVPLRADIDLNSSKIALAQEDIKLTQGEIEDIRNVDIENINGDIENINIAIVSINDRIDALVPSDPLESDLVFSGFFTQSRKPRFGLMFDWAEFKSNATGSFSSIEIKNSLISNGIEIRGSAVCADPVVADAIVKEFNTHVPTGGVVQSFTCFEQTLGRDVEWNIGSCNEEVELNASLNTLHQVCVAGNGAVVRPLIGTVSWGGVGTDFGGLGGTAGALSQTLEVILTR